MAQQLPVDIAVPNPYRASSSGTPITSTATVVSAPASGSHLKIVRIHASNGGSTATWIRWRDGASGTQYYPTYLPQNGIFSINLKTSGPLELSSATRLDLVMSAAGSVEYQVDYEIIMDL